MKLKASATVEAALICPFLCLAVCGMFPPDRYARPPHRWRTAGTGTDAEQCDAYHCGRCGLIWKRQLRRPNSIGASILSCCCRCSPFRLFSARQKIKSEVEEMAETYNKPVALDKIDYVIWGTGSPAWGDPRNVCTRMFSNHIVWLCHKKPMSAHPVHG